MRRMRRRSSSDTDASDRTRPLAPCWTPWAERAPRDRPCWTSAVGSVPSSMSCCGRGSPRWSRWRPRLPIRMRVARRPSVSDTPTGSSTIWATSARWPTRCAPADIVTLDRSVCCWPDMPGLVRPSAARARRLYGLVYPRDDWWVRVGWRTFSRLRMLLRSHPMQVYVHRTRDVEAILRGQGLVRRSHRTMGVWQVAVFARP